MKKTIIIIMIFTSAFCFAQDVTQINTLQTVSEKTSATYGDAVTLFMYELGQNPGSFARNTAYLKSKELIRREYEADIPLKRGMISYMAAKYLGFNSSLMFKITKAERYAFRECISYGLMDSDGSENDMVSGEELLEIFQKINEFKGNGK